MIAAPTMTTVFQFFGNDLQPQSIEEIEKRYQDPELAQAYLHSLVSDGLILRNEKGYYMSLDAFEAGIADCEEKIKRWEERLEHLKRTRGQIFPTRFPVPKDIWRKIIAFCENDAKTEEQIASHLGVDLAKAEEYLAPLKLHGLGLTHTGWITNTGLLDYCRKLHISDDRNPTSYLEVIALMLRD